MKKIFLVLIMQQTKEKREKKKKNKEKRTTNKTLFRTQSNKLPTKQQYRRHTSQRS
jgi:hypothetical protein